MRFVDQGMRVAERLSEWRELSKHDARYLPPNQDPDEPITLAVWVDDMSHHPPSARILQESRELAHAGQGKFLLNPKLHGGPTTCVREYS